MFIKVRRRLGGDTKLGNQLASWVVGDNKPDATLVLDVSC